ncbi:hypothetical protein ACLOJK_000906 [Asimina triloba]
MASTNSGVKMASTNSGGYMIFHPEKAGLFDILRLCLFKRRLSDCKFVETSEASLPEQENVRTNGLLLALSMLFQGLLCRLQAPLAFFGACLEFMLNFFTRNDGLFGLIVRLITGSIVFPDKNSADYRTILAFLDSRMDLHKASSLLSGPPQVRRRDTAQILDACIMASKVVYENEAYVKNAVTKHWQMEFVGFYNCWNVFQKAHSTQAFIFSYRPENGKVMIVVAFRGTEPFNGRDWATDVDLSWISMGKMGRAHMGFMKALGMQDERDYRKGWPVEYVQGDEKDDKPLAYYVIREKLKTLLREHKEADEDAHIIFTGHSLGGALAALFPTILMLHEETTILNRVWGAITYGQPRVGDATFASFVDAAAAHKNFRAIYRYDAVPRVPFDGSLFQFKHFGNCIYYNGWYDGQVMKEEPNKNGLDPLHILSKYYHGVEDLVKAEFLGKKEGKEFEERGLSILVRVALLILPGLASHFPTEYVNAARLGRLRVFSKDLV